MKKTTRDPAAQTRESVRRWYARHRDEYSALRKKRYRSDPERRAKARKAAALYRKKRAKGLPVQRTLTRMLNGKPVEVFTTGYIADRVSVSTPVVRSWHERGYLPPTLFPESRHRLYTARQVELIRLLADTLKTHNRVGVSRATKSKVLSEVVSVIHKTWKGAEHGSENGQKTRRRAR